LDIRNISSTKFNPVPLIKNANNSEIPGTHSGEYEDDCLISEVLRWAIMEIASTSETSVNFCQTVQRIIPEDSQLHHFTARILISFLITVSNIHS
jgi:hypothetical protein